MIESLQKFHHYYGDDFKLECPTGSGRLLTIGEVADELSARLAALPPGRRTAAGPARRDTANKTPISATSSCSTSISMATTGAASGPPIRPAGPAWSPRSSNLDPPPIRRRKKGSTPLSSPADDPGKGAGGLCMEGVE